MTELDYNELRALALSTKYSIHQPTKKLKDTFERKIAKILKTQKSRVFLNVEKNEIILDLKHNREVSIRFSELMQLQVLFGADDFAIYSPIRCELKIKIIRRQD